MSEQSSNQSPVGVVFTEAFKARNRIVASAATVLASAAPFATGLVLVTYCVADPVGWVASLITAGAFVASVTLTWLVQDRFALLGNNLLRQHLGLRLRDERRAATCAGETAFVGFAPGDDVCTWGGETDLDVGFLCIAQGGMVFLGDRFSWSLAKDRIDQIDLTPPPAGPRRIVVRWHAPREPRRAFTLESRDAQSLTGAVQATVGLFRGLRKWSLEPAEEDNRLALGNPPTGDYGGKSVHEMASGSCAVLVAMTTIIVLTVWYLVSQMLQDGFYCHAILWAGFVFVGGAVFTRCLLHYLQSTEKPRPRPRPGQGTREQWPF